MSVFTYEAKELYNWLTTKQDIVIVDVRNNKEFGKFKVEGPYPFQMLNIPYYDFMEFEEESIGKLPTNSKIRIVCAKEASAKYVSEIIDKNGFEDVGYLLGGINTWGNLLVPRLMNPDSDDYELYQFIRPGKASCNYGLIVNNEMMLFDPSRNVEFYLDFARSKDCTIIKTFETHLQADYIAGSRLISEKTGAEFLGNEGDFKGSKINYTKLVDGSSFTFSGGAPKVRVLFTPGHTPGSTSFIIGEKYMVSGDTVFIESIGRPDLGGQAEQWSGLLFDTMNKVKQLDSNITIMPGHYMDWNEADEGLIFECTLAEAIKRNQSIYDIDNLDDFIKFIKANIRPQPEEYKKIRLVNANLEQVDEEEQNTLDIGKNECAATAYASTQES